MDAEELKPDRGDTVGDDSTRRPGFAVPCWFRSTPSFEAELAAFNLSITAPPDPWSVALDEDRHRRGGPPLPQRADADPIGPGRGPWRVYRDRTASRSRRSASIPCTLTRRPALHDGAVAQWGAVVAEKKTRRAWPRTDHRLVATVGGVGLCSAVGWDRLAPCPGLRLLLPVRRRSSPPRRAPRDRRDHYLLWLRAAASTCPASSRRFACGGPRSRPLRRCVVFGDVEAALRGWVAWTQTRIRGSRRASRRQEPRRAVRFPILRGAFTLSCASRFPVTAPKGALARRCARSLRSPSIASPRAPARDVARSANDTTQPSRSGLGRGRYARRLQLARSCSRTSARILAPVVGFEMRPLFGAARSVMSRVGVPSAAARDATLRHGRQPRFDGSAIHARGRGPVIARCGRLPRRNRTLFSRPRRLAETSLSCVVTRERARCAEIVAATIRQLVR